MDETGSNLQCNVITRLTHWRDDVQSACHSHVTRVLLARSAKQDVFSCFHAKKISIFTQFLSDNKMSILKPNGVLSESVIPDCFIVTAETALTCNWSHEGFKLLVILAQVHHQQSAKGNVKCGSTAHVFVSSSCVRSKERKVLTLEINKTIFGRATVNVFF